MVKFLSDLPKETFWHHNDGEIELIALLTLRRNVERFLFPSKLDKEKRSQILSLLSQELLKADPSDKLYLGEECSPIDKEWLQEHYLLPFVLQEAYLGEGFLLDAAGKFGAFFNIGDHLQLRFLGGKAEIKEGWEILSKKDDKLQENSPFAFSPYWGFLTANPQESGTGLQVEVLLQTPALSLFREEERHLFDSDDRIESIQLFSQGAGIERGLLLIRNRSSIGMSEDQIVLLVENFSDKVIAKEKALRQKLITEEEGPTKDRVSRAYGLLAHSYQIETLEAIEALGWLKFGLEAGWLKGVDNKKLNSLLIEVRRGHLTRRINSEATREELLHRRAELLHQELKGTELLV
jgi:protein arginine kinase